MNHPKLTRSQLINHTAESILGDDERPLSRHFFIFNPTFFLPKISLKFHTFLWWVDGSQVWYSVWLFFHDITYFWVSWDFGYPVLLILHALTWDFEYPVLLILHALTWDFGYPVFWVGLGKFRALWGVDATVVMLLEYDMWSVSPTQLVHRSLHPVCLVGCHGDLSYFVCLVGCQGDLSHPVCLVGCHGDFGYLVLLILHDLAYLRFWVSCSANRTWHSLPDFGYPVTITSLGWAWKVSSSTRRWIGTSLFHMMPR